MSIISTGCLKIPLVLCDKDGSDPLFPWQFGNLIAGLKWCTAHCLSAANKREYSQQVHLCIIYLTVKNMWVCLVMPVYSLWSDFHTIVPWEAACYSQLCPVFRCARPSYSWIHDRCHWLIALRIFLLSLKVQNPPSHVVLSTEQKYHMTVPLAITGWFTELPLTGDNYFAMPSLLWLVV